MQSIGNKIFDKALIKASAAYTSASLYLEKRIMEHTVWRDLLISIN